MSVNQTPGHLQTAAASTDFTVGLFNNQADVCLKLNRINLLTKTQYVNQLFCFF